MAKRKSDNNNIIKNVIVLILLLLLIVGIVIAMIYLTGGFGGSITPFGVKYGGKTYFTPQNGLSLQAESEFELVGWIGDDFDVTISVNGSSDLTVTLDGNTVRWSELDGTNVTNGFRIVKTGNAFSLSYDSLEAILERSTGKSVELAETPTDELFRIQITSGGFTLRLGFKLCLIPTKIELSPNEIVF